MEKPWLTESPLVDIPTDPDDRQTGNATFSSLAPLGNGITDESFQSAGKTGLMFFLAVITSLFALFVSAYFIRMELDDWTPLAEPTILWTNTLLLIFGSIAIQLTSYGVKDHHLSVTRYALLATGIFTWAFIAGQLIAWQQLVDNGFYLQTNPANAFFYVITGLHGLHMLGGLWVWFRTTLKIWLRKEHDQVAESIELCRTYWHYLLLVWLGLFALLLST